MDTNKEKRQEFSFWISGVLGFIGLIAIILFAGNYHFKTALGNINTTPNYQVATNASSTCGQLASGRFVIGATSSTISNTSGTMFYTIVVDGNTVTSTAVTTTTALTIANNLLQAIQSSTLNISDSTGTDGTLVFINVTSTKWGDFVTLAPNHDQLGIIFTPTVTFPSTLIVTSTAARYNFTANLDASSTQAKYVYICKGASCALGTGTQISTSSDAYVQNSTDQYNGAYSCISTSASSTASSSLLNVTYSQ